MPYPDRNRDLPYTSYSQFTTAAGGAVLLLPAAGAGKNYIFRVQLSNSAAYGNDVYIQSAGSTTHLRSYLAASGGGMGPSVWLISNPNTQVNLVVSAATAVAISYMVEAYILGSA